LGPSPLYARAVPPDHGTVRGTTRHRFEEMELMELTLTDDEATELRDLLDGSLGDLSSEIADTDNPSFRLALKQRRVHLQAVRSRLTGKPAA
jgi:hypothetical protein